MIACICRTNDMKDQNKAVGKIMNASVLSKLSPRMRLQQRARALKSSMHLSLQSADFTMGCERTSRNARIYLQPSSSTGSEQIISFNSRLAQSHEARTSKGSAEHEKVYADQ